MHPVAFRKAMIEAYLAGAQSMYCGCYDNPSREQAKDWVDNQYGIIEEECDCCEEKEDE